MPAAAILDDPAQQISPKLADWDQAKLMRFQGIAYKEIAQMLGVTEGCVRARASRQNWSRTEQKAEQAVELATKNLVHGTLKQRADRFIEVMADDCEEAMELARKGKKPKGMKGLYLRESVLEKLNKRARLTYGLDSDATSRVSAGAMNIQVNVSVPGAVESSESVKIEPEC